jgi:hypothetical protein
MVVAYWNPSYVNAVVSISGPTDMTDEYSTAGGSLVAHYEQAAPSEQPNRYAVTSPVAVASASSPPTFQGVASADDLVPTRQISALSGKLANAGVQHQEAIVPGSDHATAVEWERPAGDSRTVASIAYTFVKSVLGSP